MEEEVPVDVVPREVLAVSSTAMVAVNRAIPTNTIRIRVVAAMKVVTAAAETGATAMVTREVVGIDPRTMADKVTVSRDSRAIGNLGKVRS